MKKYRADLHIHTCLSPCGDYGMYPSAIVGRALEKGLDIIAVCDHNSIGNVRAVAAAGKRAGLAVLGGMEICAEEEVHVLAIFDDPEDLEEMDRIISSRMEGENDPDVLGEQVLFDGNDNIVGLEDRLLVGSCGLAIEEIAEAAKRLNGLVIPSHVNREAYGLLGVLGYIPDSVPFDALEVAASGFPGSEELLVSPLPQVHFSDAHYLDRIGLDYTGFYLEKPTAGEIAMALKGAGGRRMVY